MASTPGITGRWTTSCGASSYWRVPRLIHAHIPFAMFRLHDQQKTGQDWAQTQSLIKTAVKLVDQAPDLPEQRRQRLVADLHAYDETIGGTRSTGSSRSAARRHSVARVHTSWRRRACNSCGTPRKGISVCRRPPDR